MTIWKYPLEAEDEQVMAMPKGARILTVQTQNETPCLWAMVNPTEARIEKRKIYTHGTGHPVADDPDTLAYLGTYQLRGGALVFHVFERFEPPTEILL